MLDLPWIPRWRLWRARRALDRGDFAGALAIVETVLARRPGHPRALLLRGFVFRGTGDYARAVEDLSAGLRRHPGFAPGYLWRAGALGGLGRFADALADLDQAVGLEPRCGEYRAWRGGALAKCGRTAEALAELDAAIRLDPGFPRAYVWRGMLHHDAGRSREALADLDRAAALDPREEWTYAKRSLVKRRLGDWAGALADLEEAVRHNDIYDWAWAGKRNEEQGRDYGHALADIERAIAALPGSGRAYAWRGQTLLKLGRHREALEDLDRALALSPEFPWAWAWRGEARRRAGRAEEALRDLDQAIALDARYGRSHGWKGAALLDLGREQEAEESLERAVALSPRQPDAHTLLGEARLRRGRPEEARRALDEALRLNPLDGRARDCLRLLPGASLALLLALLPAASAPAREAAAFGAALARARGELAFLRLWDALELAKRAAALPGASSLQRAAALREAARARILLGDSAGAASDLREALRLAPGDGEAQLALAGLLREQPEQALRYAEAAAWAAILAARRAAALRLAAELRWAQGDREGAGRRLEESLALRGDDLDSLGVAARIRRDRPEDAVALARRAARAAARAPFWCRGSAHRFSARLWMDLGRPAQAESELARALARDPDDLEALRTLLNIRRGKAGAPEPPAEFSPVSAAGPSSKFHSGPSAAPSGRGAADAGSPDPLEVLRGETLLRRLQDRPEEARTAAERFLLAVLDAPGWQRADAYRLAAGLWTGLGDAAAARACLALARALDEQSPATLRRILRLGPPSGGVAPDQQSLAEAYQAVIHARLELGDPGGAQAALARALALLPDHPPLLASAARTELALGKPEAAGRYARRLLEVTQRQTLADVVGRVQSNTAVQAARDPGEQARLTLRDPQMRQELERVREADRRLARDVMSELGRGRGDSP